MGQRGLRQTCTQLRLLNVTVTRSEERTLNRNSTSVANPLLWYTHRRRCTKHLACIWMPPKTFDEHGAIPLRDLSMTWQNEPGSDGFGRGRQFSKTFQKLCSGTTGTHPTATSQHAVSFRFFVDCAMCWCVSVSQAIVFRLHGAECSVTRSRWTLGRNKRSRSHRLTSRLGLSTELVEILSRAQRCGIVQHGGWQQ